MKIESIDEVVQKQLCIGCGVCSYLEPDRYIMKNALEFGNRPFIGANSKAESFEAITACPGAALSHPGSRRNDEGIISNLYSGWGPILGVWEGYAQDEKIRFSGSSGGACSAIALYSLERDSAVGVLHTAARRDFPYLNESVLSTSKNELVERTGSRYAPASPAEGLGLIENAKGSCVFIGKPCDAAAVQSARKLRPQLDEKISLVIAFFCAGTPSTKGTLDLLKENGVEDLKRVKNIRYRGNGWPGFWHVECVGKTGDPEKREMSYKDSWAFLQKYRQWRCYICPDHTGEFADIAVGDPWYREIMPGEPGKSLIVARTRRGYEIIKAAEAAGYLVLEKEDNGLLALSQPNLLKARSTIWARLLVLRLLGAAVPRYEGFSLLKLWAKKLSFREKFQSLFGTAKRVFSKRLNKKVDITESRPGGD